MDELTNWLSNGDWWVVMLGCALFAAVFSGVLRTAFPRFYPTLILLVGGFLPAAAFFVIGFLFRPDEFRTGSTSDDLGSFIFDGTTGFVLLAISGLLAARLIETWLQWRYTKRHPVNKTFE